MMASVQAHVGDFFARCELSATGENRTIETDGIITAGEAFGIYV